MLPRQRVPLEYSGAGVVIMNRRHALALVTVALLCACGTMATTAGSDSTNGSNDGSNGGSNGGTAGITVTAGTWSYSLTAEVPLPGGTGPTECAANPTGTTAVSSSGTFSIPYSVGCSNCSMTGTVTGTIVPTSVSGSVTASTSGSGCSNQAPTPSPASMSGTCNSTDCMVSTSQSQNPNLSYSVSYTITPP